MTVPQLAGVEHLLKPAECVPPAFLHRRHLRRRGDAPRRYRLPARPTASASSP